MRRRLWWQLLILDVRCAEDHDMEPIIYEHSFSTKHPSNLNDSDIHEGLMNTINPTIGRTEMLFTLSRFQISYAVRKLMFSTAFTEGNGYPLLKTEAEKISFLDALSAQLHERYLQYCDENIPICFMTATANNLILSKIRLLVRRPSLQHILSQESVLNDYLLRNSMDIVEAAHALRTNPDYQRWAWLFQKYIEWDAIAILLCSLIALPGHEVKDRAWVAVQSFFRDWNELSLDTGQQHRWQQILQLKIKADTSRETHSGSSRSTHHGLGQSPTPEATVMSSLNNGQGENEPHRNTDWTVEEQLQSTQDTMFQSMTFIDNMNLSYGDDLFSWNLDTDGAHASDW